MPNAQAKIIVTAIAESQENLVTNEVLASEISAFKHYLLWRITLIGLGLVAFARVLAHFGV